MSTVKSFRILIVLPFLLLTSVLTNAQADKKQAELKKLETSLATAKAKVALNEQQLTKSDSLINLGTQMITESKTETKAIEAERKKLNKDNITSQKPLTKLSTSKDKEESNKARADLKALDVQYKSDSKALDTRLKDATKISRKALDTAQEKYDDANGSGVNTSSKEKKKK